MFSPYPPALSLFNAHWKLRSLPDSTSPIDSSDSSSNTMSPCSASLSSNSSNDFFLSPFQDTQNLPRNIKHQYDGPVDDSKSTRQSASLSRRHSSLATPVRGRPVFRSQESNSSSRSTGSISSPDRFLPARRPALNACTESFRTNKEISKLTTEERFLRHNGASRDVFNPRRRITAPVLGTPMPSRRRTFSAGRYGGVSVLAFQRDSASPTGHRQLSVGTIWSVGGAAPVTTGVSNGRGGFLGNGTNAPMYTTNFSAARPIAQDDTERHEGRLAEALELDRARRVLEFRESSPLPLGPRMIGKHRGFNVYNKTVWRGSEWMMGESNTLLDAPNLRDDFYCSVLAYSATCRTLAVGLGSLLYAWSEDRGVILVNSGSVNGSWLTSMAFSSVTGRSSILASGRSDGTLYLMSLNSEEPQNPRFEIHQPCPIACITWRPITTLRPSRNPIAPGVLVKTEDLFVGDEVGNVYYYTVEWAESHSMDLSEWTGSMTLLTRIAAHTQQICGLSFSPDGSMFATGGNDNLCCLYRSQMILRSTRQSRTSDDEIFIDADGHRCIYTIDDRGDIRVIPAGFERHRWVHGAAVKAIAFCPWRDGLVATGGGSNDKCIHFYHTSSGACLATISVAAQVTSLIWSTTRRELVATFGYAQPEHPYRIAIFSWPECKQVAAIPWDGEHRALYAIAYPGGPNESRTSREGSRSMSRTAKEGCIVVASSDESVKFHEVWTAGLKSTGGGEGLLGGSDILEELEGIEKEAEVIR